MSKNKVVIGIAIALILFLSGSALVVALSGGGGLSKQLKLGEKYLSEGKYEEAILAFEKAIKIDEKNIDARIGLGKAYVAIEKPEKAEEVLKAAILIDPKNLEANILMVELYIKQEKFEEVVAAASKGYSNTGDAKLKQLNDEYGAIPDAPKANFETGKYDKELSVVLTKSGEGSEIYYTVDGSEPDRDKLKYSAPVKLKDGKTVIKAVQVSKYGVVSEKSVFEYDINAYQQLRDILECFDMTRTEIIAKYGREYEIVQTDIEGSSEGLKFINKGITITFDYENQNQVSFINCDDTVDIKGVKAGMRFKEIQAILGKGTIEESRYSQSYISPDMTLYELIYSIDGYSVHFTSNSKDGNDGTLPIVEIDRL